jgi:hypothetical protein
MTLLEISDKEHGERLDQPFNPPDVDMPEDEFNLEYYSLYDRVDLVMARHGVNDAYGQGDYCLEPYIARSRGLGMEVTNPDIITHKLLEELQDILAAHARNWEIYLRSGEFDYGIFIGASAVRLQRKSKVLLKQLFE